jgi:hypothetical protein
LKSFTWEEFKKFLKDFAEGIIDIDKYFSETPEETEKEEQ